jgi:hypothetical protein
MGKLPRKPVVRRIKPRSDEERRLDNKIKKNPKVVEGWEEIDVGEYEKLCREGDDE